MSLDGRSCLSAAVSVQELRRLLHRKYQRKRRKRKGEFVTVVTVGLQVCQKCDKRGKAIVIFGDKKPLNLLYITDKLSHVVI